MGKQESRRQTRQRGAHSDQYRMGQSVHESITGQSLAINHMKHSINQYYLRLCGKQIHVHSGATRWSKLHAMKYILYTSVNNLPRQHSATAVRLYVLTGHIHATPTSRKRAVQRYFDRSGRINKLMYQVPVRHVHK